MPRSTNPVGRPKKPASDRAVAIHFSAYPKEAGALASIATAKGFRTNWDYLRSLIIADDHPRGRGFFREPRKFAPGSRT